MARRNFEAPPADRPYRVAFLTPEELAAWPDDRVRCDDCAHRSGYMCIALRTSIVINSIPHWCDSFSKAARLRK